MTARSLPAPLVVASPAVAHAAADAHAAVSAAALAHVRDGAEARQVAFAGTGGLGYARASRDDCAFAAVGWSTLHVEAGRARRLAATPRLDARGALSVATSLCEGFSGGLRGTLASGARFGETLVVRPSLPVSLAQVFSPYERPAALLPVEAGVALGLRAFAARPFLRVAAGADVLASDRFTGRGEIAPGFALCLEGPDGGRRDLGAGVRLPAEAQSATSAAGRGEGLSAGGICRCS